MAFAATSNSKNIYYWVCDGYKEVDVYGNVYREIKSNTVDTKWELVESHKVGEDILLHFNWGDYGRCNGYFSISVYKPVQGAIYDNAVMNEWKSDFEFTNSMEVFCFNFKKR